MLRGACRGTAALDHGGGGSAARRHRQSLLPARQAACWRERDLAEQFGVSAGACIREALGVLIERRLVVRYPNRGVEATRLGRAEIVSIYEVREYLDGLCGRLATERSRPGSWQDMVELFAEPAARAVEQGDIERLSWLSRPAGQRGWSTPPAIRC